MKRLFVIAMLLAVGTACDKPQKPDGPIRCDGSSTVYPITRELADRFSTSSSTKFLISAGGTGAGLEKFCSGEVDLAGASRQITAKENQKCKRAGVDYVELPIALDGIAIVVHPDNDWVDYLTIAELKRIWSASAQGEVTRWSDIRQGWPSEPIKLHAPGLDSGTYDFFNRVVLARQASRSDYDSSESDNVIVDGVARDLHGLGYFSLAYARGNAKKVRAVPIDDEDDSNGAGAVPATIKTIGNRTYQPFSRPVYLYVSVASAEQEEVDAFIEFYLHGVAAIAEEVGFAPLKPKRYSQTRQRFAERITGSTAILGSGAPTAQ